MNYPPNRPANFPHRLGPHPPWQSTRVPRRERLRLRIGVIGAGGRMKRFCSNRPPEPGRQTIPYQIGRGQRRLRAAA